MGKADFVLQWLEYLGAEIYNKGKRILEQGSNKEWYTIKPMDTKIRVGQELGDEADEENYVSMTWGELTHVKLTIKKDTSVKPWQSRQASAYVLTRKQSNSKGITYVAYKHGRVKTNLRIEHDTYNRRVRLTGSHVLPDPSLPITSGIGPWVVYDEDVPIRITNFTKIPATNKRKMFTMMRGDDNDEEQKEQLIEEIPVLITPNNYIVCVKKESVAMRWIIVGETRYGKSLLTNALAGRIFYKFEDCVGWVCDPMNQFHSLSLPQPVPAFNNTNSVINDSPMPIPAIQFYMACRNIAKPEHKKISLTLTQNFSEFLTRYDYYTNGIEEFKIPGSITYLKRLIPSLRNVRTIEDFEEILHSEVEGFTKEKSDKLMTKKWISKIGIVFKEKFTSNLYLDNPLATDMLEIRLKNGTIRRGHPFIMAMIAGAIPVINATGCSQEAWFRNYLADVMRKTVLYQMATPRTERRKMYLIVDELNMIHEKGKRKDHASIQVENLFRQGGFNDIGFVGNSQSLGKLNPEIYNNASHVACVYMRDAADRKRLRTTFGLDDDVDDEQRSLKKGEVMVFSKEPFVVYDRWGRRKVVENKVWFKGKIFPPINFHNMPTKTKK